MITSLTVKNDLFRAWNIELEAFKVDLMLVPLKPRRLAILGVLLLAGCATPDLRLVSKPAMQFGELRGYATNWRMASQLEPGRLATGGAQVSVCAFCR